MENEKEVTNQNELENSAVPATNKTHRQRIPYGERVVPTRRNFESHGNYRSRYNNNYNNDGGGYRQPYQRNDGSYRGRYNDDNGVGYQADGSAQTDYHYHNRPYDENAPRGRYGNNNGSRRSFAPRGYNNGYGRPQNSYQKGGYQKKGYSYNQGRGSNFRGNGRPGGYQQRTADYDPSAKYNVQKVLRYKEANIDPEAPIRLNRFLSNAGICSRREADQYIANGQITVNGEVITELGHKVLRTDEVCYNGKPVSIEDKVYVLLNKPKDYVTTADDPEGRKTVMDLVKGACPERIYPVGRLDRNTTGVLLLTNDGEMAAKMMHPKFMKKKIYHVYCNKPVSFADMQKILEGIILEDGEIHADRIEYASEADRKQIGIEIHSGKNRIVRRIFENLGYRVVKLDRVYFAGLTKKNLRRGHWRFLEEAEVNMLRMGAYE